MATTPSATADAATPTRERLSAARTEVAEVVREGGSAEPLNLGERAFEIVFARRVAAGEAETQWFARHGSTPITELPAHWPDAYRRTVEARIALIEKRRDLALIERPSASVAGRPRAGASSRSARCATGCSTASKPATCGSPPT